MSIIRSHMTTSGSSIAKNGYKAEQKVADALNKNIEFKSQFSTFIKQTITSNFYKLDGTSKTDVTNGTINIQVKKCAPKRFGQVDRCWLSKLIKNNPTLKPIEHVMSSVCEMPLMSCGKLCDKTAKRTKLTHDHFNHEDIRLLLSTLNENKKQILNHAFNGYEIDTIPHYFFGLMGDSLTIYRVCDIIDHLMTFDFKIRKSGTVIELGNSFTIQRKGGDSGKKTANQIQFKLVFSNLKIEHKMTFNI